jgi:hypothetical protein
VADNVRLGNEEEEALRRKSHDEDNDGYRGGGVKEEVEGEVDVEGEGEGRKRRGLFSCPHLEYPTCPRQAL